ncbi:RND family transporter [Mycobacterium sp. 48b]|uniref:MMPL/RND family transporter n=1 Tax=Mycobacterium sp. 48b TaxID=3400426 RepID=UPI003AB00AA6
MLSRAKIRGAFARVGFAGLGQLVVRRPLTIIVSWVLLALSLWLAVPSLMEVAQKNPPDFLPADAPVLVAGQKMKDAFHEADAGNFAVVVLSNENGLTTADEDSYRNLVAQLKANSAVTSTQNFVDIPELREAMTSKDQKAWTLPVSLSGTMGTGPGQEAYRSAIKTVNEATQNSGLAVNVVGAAATFDDIDKIGARDQHIIEIATVVMVLTILIIVYRNLVAMLIPLITIGISMVVAQQVVAALGELGLGLGPQTIVLMTGMLMGAGTDYAVFLFSRYQELTRDGMSSDVSIVSALSSIGEVIAGSAATVAITFLGLMFTKLGAFSTVGPALAVTVFIGFLASVTLLPSLITLAGRRGWVKPRRDVTGRFWRRSGIHVVRRPLAHLAGSLVILVALAGCAAMVKFNYDDRKALPADSSSNRGYEAMDKHFPISQTLQQFILIESPQDLRTPKALADMEQMAQRVSQLPDIDVVRGITRPTGEVLEQAKATYQAGEVGGKLRDASNLIEENNANLDMLSGGAHQLADVLGQVRTQVVGAIGSVRGLVGALTQMQKRFGGSKTLTDVDSTSSLVGNMRALGDALRKNVSQAKAIHDWAKPAVDALNVSPACNLDPACVSSRSDLQRVVAAYDDGTANTIADLSKQLESTDGSSTLDDTVRQLESTMSTATNALQQLGMDDPQGLQRQINTAVEGANLLADSSRQLADGVQLLVDQTRTMGGGLDQASGFLLGMKRDAANPPMSGFYIPPEVLTQTEFEKAAKLFVSDDGHTVRYLVQTALNPFGSEAMDQIDQIIATANSAKPNTTLSDAEISMVGFSAVNRDIRGFYNADIRYIVCITLIVVFLILVALLRAVVAPLYLVLSVVLSYLSALGIGVLLFQFILGRELSWSVPGMAFLVLVAVGADYNLLLISRIRDESRLGIRSGVIKTVGATGGVITSAGLIFAASMLALTVSSIASIVEIGFIIGVGLLLDTFLVRTITVPAAAVLIGKLNWWPLKPPHARHAATRPGEQEAVGHGQDGSEGTEASDVHDAGADTEPAGAPGDLSDSEQSVTDPVGVRGR